MSQMAARPSSPCHHPDEALLLDYVTGALDAQRSLVIACHIALCPECRQTVHLLDALGGAMLEEVIPSATSETLFARTLAAAQANAPAVDRIERTGGGAGIFPPVLEAIIVESEAERQWRRVVPGLKRIDLGESDGWRLRLLRISAGCAMPQHRHGGQEMTLVLSGAFRDEHGAYGRGDLCMADGEHQHRPIADQGEDCLCLVAESGSLRLSGGLGNVLSMLFPRRGGGGAEA